MRLEPVDQLADRPISVLVTKSVTGTFEHDQFGGHLLFLKRRLDVLTMADRDQVIVIADNQQSGRVIRRDVHQRRMLFRSFEVQFQSRVALVSGQMVRSVPRP